VERRPLVGSLDLTLRRTVSLPVEIAREERNGRRRVGVTFVVGNSKEVLVRSWPLALDPLRGHPAHLKRLDDPGARATLKQLARLGETFVVSDEGVALSMLRIPGAPSGGSDGSQASWCGRHETAASISGHTAAVAVVVCEDSAVQVFEGGRLVHEISLVHEPDLAHPELGSSDPRRCPCRQRRVRRSSPARRKRPSHLRPGTARDQIL
jgi:DNA integrity scanning protein DisA with diadenylate cyclase activity